MCGVWGGGVEVCVWGGVGVEGREGMGRERVVWEG